MTRLSTAQAYKPVEVDFFGHEFTTADVTRSGAEKAAVYETELEGIDGSEFSEQIKILGKLLDLKLVSANGSKTKASTLLKRAWEADEISALSIRMFLQRLNAAEEESALGRPS